MVNLQDTTRLDLLVSIWGINIYLDMCGVDIYLCHIIAGKGIALKEWQRNEWELLQATIVNVYITFM